MTKLLSGQDIQRCAAMIDVPVPALRAVIAVESAGSGFIADGLPKILFEGHIFHRETDGAYADERPDLCYERWTKAHYKGGRGEYDRLLDAIDFDADAAMRSCSWGLGQVMGFNHAICGHATIDDFVNAMAESEGRQLEAMCGFIRSNKLDDELRDAAWADFARRYNGPGYKANAYDTKLASAFARARHQEERGEGVPIVEDRARVAELQTALNATTNAGLAVDGWWGPKTRRAVMNYQRAQGLAATGEVDDELLERLGIGGQS